VKRNRGDINSVVNAFKTVGRFAKEVFQDTMLPIIRRTMNAIGPIVDGLVHTIRGLVRLVSGLLSGNWDKAWSGAKEAVGGAFKAIKTIVVTQVENLWDIIKKLGPKLVKGILTGLKNMGSALAHRDLRGIKAAAAQIPGSPAPR
jgi:phage-related protein